jgi:hypothetical protein
MSRRLVQLQKRNSVRIDSAWKRSVVYVPATPSPWAGFPGGYDNWRAMRDHLQKLRGRKMLREREAGR